MKKRSWIVLIDERHEKNFFNLAQEVFESFVSLNPEFSDLGGCLIIRSRIAPIVKTKHLGKLRPIASRNNALELAKKLADVPACLSSTQIKENPGAIIAEDVILSFSGFSGHGNEAIVLALAVKLGWVVYEEATAITGLSGNPLFENLHQLIIEKTPRAF